MTKADIAIIGGGASAALLLANLMHRPNVKGLSIDVYDRSGTFGRGIAYSTPHLCHLLNVRALNMSALAHDPDHFAQWAAPKGYKASDFVPRKFYGDYLTEQIMRTQDTLSINWIADDVHACRLQENGHYDLATASRTITYSTVIQATGNCVPMRPRLPKPVAGYYDSPWQVDYAALKHLKTIALIGSGLSAVDAMLALHAHGYVGEIKILSRSALLPATHIKVDAYPAFLSALPNTALQALRIVRREINNTHAPWQAVIDSLRAYTNPIWAHWSEAQRQIFMKRLLTFWNVHRHRMAPQIAAVIEALEQSGQLTRLRTTVRGVAAGPTVLTVQGDIAADAIINCLGYRYQERDLASSFAIGPARFGALFETTAIPEIRTQAAQIAAQIA